MERAKWLLLMNVKRKLQAMGWGFTTEYRKPCFRRFCSQTFALQQAPPRRGAFVPVQKVRLWEVSPDR
jgi:hypothetical protein